MTDRDIHRLGLPVRCAALGCPDTTEALAVLRDWGEAVWTDPLCYRLAVLNVGVARVTRRVAAIDRAVTALGYPARPPRGVS